MKHKRKEVLFFDCENWTINIIGASGNTRAVTWKDVLKCVWFYMGSKENGSLKKRITSVLMRLLTCTLKPKQVFQSVAHRPLLTADKTMRDEYLICLRHNGAVVVETKPPYRISVLNEYVIRAATLRDTLAALRKLRQYGNLSILRLLATFVKKAIMSRFRSSQQQLFTAHEYTPEELSTFMRWEKEIEGAHDLPQ